MSALSVKLLGPPSIHVDGRPLAVDTRKALALVALLAVAGEPRPRRSLAAILWPETDEEHASGALRRTLSVLRAALGGRWVEATDGLVTLSGPDLDCDVLDERAAWDVLAAHAAGAPGFGGGRAGMRGGNEGPAAAGTRAAAGHAAGDAARCAACVEALETIVALHRGPFMAGFALRDSAEFDDWQAATTSDTERRLARALERLAGAYAAAGRHDEELTTAERLLALDPLNEAAYRELMQVAAERGDRAGAIRRYRECVRILDEQLSVEPLPETTELYRRILAGGSAEAQQVEAGARPAGGAADRVEGGDEPVALAGAGGPFAAGTPPPFTAGALRRPAVPSPRARAGGEETAGREPSAAADVAVEAHPARLPFVGRDRQLGTLLEAWRSAGTRGRVALVEGEPGIGKTRLRLEMEAAVSAAGGRVVGIECFREDVHFPYAAAMELVRRLSSDAPQRLDRLPGHVRIELGRLLPEFAPTGLAPDARADLPATLRPVDEEIAHARLVEALAGAMIALAEPEQGAPPTLLALDDVQWIDSPTAELLVRMRRRIPAARLLMLLCRRPPVGPDSIEPLARPGADLSTIRLGRLGEADVAELLRLLRRDEPARRLHERTEGVPLYLEEALVASASPGRAATTDVAATEGPSIGIAVSPAIRALHDARVRGLSAAARQVLGAAAVLGRSIEPDLVREVSGRSDEETVGALEELAEAGLIREQGGVEDGFAFDHPRTCDLAYAELSLARRRLLHGRAAEVLQRRARAASPSAAATAIARHLRAAGLEGDAARFLADAAADAERVYANAEALALYREAIALDPSLAAPLRARTAQLAILLGRYDDAIRDLETAIASLGPGTDAGNDAGRLEYMLGTVHARRGDRALADVHLSAALERLPATDAAARARVRLEQATVARRRGDLTAARGLADDALDLAESAGASDVLAEALNVAGMLARARGDLGAAREHLRRSLDLAGASGALGARVAALNNLALVEREADDLAAATELTEAALRICVQVGDRHREAALHNNLADLLEVAGRREQARRHVRDSVTILAELGEPGELNPEIWRLTEW